MSNRLVIPGDSNEGEYNRTSYGALSDSSEQIQLDAKRRRPVAYMLRWYIVILVAMANIMNNFLWATWGPISQSTKLVYEWSDNTLFWIVNVGNITGFLFVVLGCYLVDVKGLRVTMLVSTVIMALASATRIFTINPGKATTILIAIGQALNGVATSIMNTVPTVASKTWFLATERTTATAVSELSCAVGAAAAFLFGPLTVSMPTMNGSCISNETDIGTIRRQMKTFHFIAFGVSALLLVCCIVYFPTKPSSAPSTSAASARFNMKDGIFRIVKNPSVWLIGLIFALPLGFFGNWSSILDVELNPLGISQSEAGWIGFYGSLSGVVAGVVFSRLADHFKRKTKAIIMMLYCLAAADFAWFTCMCIGFVPRSKVTLYAAVMIANSAVSSCSPLFYEITCETAYPVGEGVVGGFLGMIVNFGAAVFLLIDQLFTTGTGWTNWAIVAVYVAGIPLLALFRAQYKRFDLDTNNSNTDNTENLSDDAGKT